MKSLAACLMVACLALGCGSRSLEMQSAGDGAAVSVGDDGGTACPAGSVTFQLNAGANDAGFYVAQVLPACWMSNWLKIFDASGAERTLIYPAPTADCRTCMPPTFSSVCGTTSMTAVKSASWTWDGTYFAGGTCGSAGTTCVAPRCAPAGHYVAGMCAAKDAQQTMAHRCVDVQFDYPAAGPVTATLPPAP